MATLDTTVRLAGESDGAILAHIDTFASNSVARQHSIERWIRSGCCHVVEIDDKIDAYAALDPYFYEQYPFIAMLIVSPDYRRSGIGRSLLSTLESISSASKIFTSTNHSNIPMQRLLTASGYEQCGTIEHLDESDPELIFYKRLA